MFIDIPLYAAIAFTVVGLVLLAWSADRFVDGASLVARRMGVSPFIIGMAIIGFGTSAPELLVSLLSAATSHSNLSLGNAYGSSIFNIAVILGVAALIRPLSVKPTIAWVSAPMLFVLSAVSFLMVRDFSFSRANGFVLLAIFAVLMPVYCWFDQKAGGRSPAGSRNQDSDTPFATALFRLVTGLAVLAGSSHLLVWGAVDISRSIAFAAGFPAEKAELFIGLTVVAAGTSLPELASAVAAARKGQHEMVLGNIVGSNLFNMLAVVGIAGSVCPFRDFSRYVVTRDIPVMAAMSLSILVLGANWRRPLRRGRIGVKGGAFWILAFIGYAIFMLKQELAG